jgi:hypothetical protein
MIEVGIVDDWVPLDEHGWEADSFYSDFNPHTADRDSSGGGSGRHDRASRRNEDFCVVEPCMWFVERAETQFRSPLLSDVGIGEINETPGPEADSV